MENHLGDLNLNWCIIYLDDVVVYAPTVKEHLVRLEAVFQKLKDTSKCDSHTHGVKPNGFFRL